MMLTTEPRQTEPQIIEPAQFCAEFRKVVEGDVPAAAKRLGISRQLVYKLLSGERKPSAKVLAKCGLKIVFLRETNGDHIAAA